MHFAVLFLAALLLLHLLSVVAVAEISVHPPVMRRPCDTDGMAMNVARSTGAAAQRIKIQADDGITLSAWWLKLPAETDDHKAVLVCHGVADTAFGVLGAALMFLRDGYSVLAPDNRGHGGSGAFVTYGVKESLDIARWQKWMAAQGITECHGFGESLGASSLLQSLKAGAHFTSVIAECPFSSFARVAFDRVQRVNASFLPKFLSQPLTNLWVKEMLFYLRLRYGVDLSEACTSEAVKTIETPILLIHGLADHETPAHHSEEIAAINRNIQLWLVPDGQHTGCFAADPDGFESRVINFARSAAGHPT